MPRSALAHAAPSPDTGGDAANNNFAFETRDFERVCGLIYKQAGISLNPSKRSMVYSRLARRLRATGHADFESYLDALEASPPSASEWQDFVNALTTNLTSFFRESHHFPVLARHLKARAAQVSRPLRIWCCAASTGEEPYSIAITAMEAFGLERPPVEIVATDIDTNVLATASRGVYRMEAVNKLESDVRRGYFLAGRNANAGLARVKPSLRALLDFRQLNLMDAQWPVDGRFDVIFCRNVMIYFDKPTQHKLLVRLVERLEPEGLFFAGHSENFAHERALFTPEGHTVYRAHAR